MEVKIKLINNGKRPEFKRNGDACLDCYANETKNLFEQERKLIPLGFALEIPEGYEAIIRPRSGNSLKGIDVSIGTIDSNYRGEVSACVINNADYPILIEKGERICQMAIRKTEQINFVEVDELSETNRGENGFGSSGR